MNIFYLVLTIIYVLSFMGSYKFFTKHTSVDLYAHSWVWVVLPILNTAITILYLDIIINFRK